jgi:hypothetical protein
LGNKQYYRMQWLAHTFTDKAKGDALVIHGSDPGNTFLAVDDPSLEGVTGAQAQDFTDMRGSFIAKWDDILVFQLIKEDYIHRLSIA